MVLSVVLLLLAAAGLGLSLWIVLPAPVFALLTLSIGAAEVSPWLMLWNLVVLGLAVLGFQHSRPHQVALVLACGGLALSALPLLQLPAAQKQFSAAMAAAFGPDYEARIAPQVRARMRSAPFSLIDSFRGIADLPVPVTSVQLARTPVPLRVDIYRPPAPGPHPALVVIYGGAWQRGDPGQDAQLSRYLASRGWAVFAIDYRHAPAWRFPAQIEDVRAALAFIRQRGAEYGADLGRVALLGRSAGAQLAMLAAYTPGLLPVRAVVSYYGPIYLADGYADPPRPDPIDTRSVLEAYLGGPPAAQSERYRLASPGSYTDRPQPPTLLVYGERDNIVEAKFARRLAQSLRASGTQVALLVIPWAGHSFDAVFSGPSNQLALYYTERFLAWAVAETKNRS
ncbi:alpha/beta hydrolase [Gloeobacter kilaueensis]|uniref:Alpha/beta hydrolase domain-containing protein n=1 Tax=Gloeobacter kilaueensis (strain ATCC BAA-2537 / CCAP 1431/1 / ULC 316 / JS1) TaxID=1183438 RepID=U5QJI0_GLOK1|nr:alpha/beta hydrolase [Gloeobacter kilaueensis]AGY59038.1 alpha/beta hydrolase domain-containing protein [Gloeobacter kilaueensis JS1]